MVFFQCPACRTEVQHLGAFCTQCAAALPLKLRVDAIKMAPEEQIGCHIQMAAQHEKAPDEAHATFTETGVTGHCAFCGQPL